MSKLENMNDLRNFIADEMRKASEKDSTPAAANAVANLAGKLISTIKIEMEYNKMLGTTPNIPFVKEREEIKKIENTQ